MPAPFHDGAAVQHQYLVRHIDGTETLGNDEGRAPLHYLLKGHLYLEFRCGIDAGSGIVQNQNRRVEEQCSRDGDALFLSAGKGQPPLADPGIVPVRQGDDIVMDAGRPGRLFDLLLGGFRNTVADIVTDGTR